MMNKGLRSLISLVTFLMTLFSLSAWDVNPSIDFQSGDWKAPASANSIKNPLKGNTAAIDAGKKLFKQMCAICHGNSGKGDGMAGMTLNPRPSDLSSEKVHSQTDGAIFWKMTEGRAPMAPYKEILKEEQRWQLVNYIRTLKK